MTSDLQHALTRLASERPILRSDAFHQLLSMIWKENEQNPGHGVMQNGAAEVIPRLVLLLERTGAEDRHQIAFMLAVLMEAEEPAGTVDHLSESRHLIKNGVPCYLKALKEVKDTDKLPNRRLLKALLYLVAHFVEDRTLITETIYRLFGYESLEFSSITGIFDSWDSAPRRSRMLLTAMGAEVCSNIGSNRLRRCTDVLVSPCCLGEVQFSETQILCTICKLPYGYRGDVIDLMASTLNEPDEFPAEVVKKYERGFRPRFVRVMSESWDNDLTIIHEEKYLERHLLPVAGPVLDLACGAGTWTTLVARIVGSDRVLALDSSHPMLTACQNSVPDALFVRASASQLPIESGVLGAANCSNALQALPDPGRAIHEIARCLRDEAPFTCFTYRAAPGMYRYFQNRFPMSRRTVFAEEQIISFSEDAGLEITDISGRSQALFFTARKKRHRV